MLVTGMMRCEELQKCQIGEHLPFALCTLLLHRSDPNSEPCNTEAFTSIIHARRE